MIKYYISLLFTGISLFATGQSIADSVRNALPGLAAAAQVELINRRFYEISSDDFESGMALGQQALAIAVRERLPESEAKTLKNLGRTCYLLGKYELALGYYHKALDRFSELNDAGGKASVLNEMAIYYSRFEEPKKAIQYTKEAEIAAIAARDSTLLSTALDNRGLIYMTGGQWAQADSLFKKVYAIRQAIRDSVGLGYVLNNLAAVATQSGDTQRAIQLLQQSVQIRERMGDRQGMAISYCNIGEAFKEAKNYREAALWFEKSLQIAVQIGFTDLRQYNYDMLSQCAQKMGDPTKALEWLQLSDVLKDSIYSVNRSRQIAEMQTKYETAKKEKDLATEQLRVRNRTFWVVALCGLLGIVLTGGFFMFKRQRDKQAQLRREAALREELLKAEMLNGVQEERLRISRDLHDNLGAELTIISSEAAKQAAKNGDPILENIGKNARTAMQQLRETIWAIRQQEASVENLSDKIIEFANKNTLFQINVTVEPPAETVRLTPGILLNLYRIAQEAIANALKHSGGDRVEVAFTYSAPLLRMVIVDNGTKGTVPDVGTGYGLRNMTYRAREIGGDCRFDTEGAGLSVQVEVPVTTQ